MSRFPIAFLSLSSVALAGMTALSAEDLPVTRVALFSSGVGYFEHRGTIKGDTTIALPFSTAEVDDALKSLVIWDLASSGGASPSVSYPSLEGLDEALRGLRIDLRGSPKVADLLARLRGAELSVDTPETLVGRIVDVEQRGTGKDGAERPTLVLLTATGVRVVALDDVLAFRFTDQAIATDFDRALALILGSRDADRRVLDVRMPGTTSREAALGYIVAAPVWKASYRLDLSGEKPWFQGWAIVDNPSQTDWKDVTLTLVSGRPVSFIQNLYAPLRLSRPVMPLSIAGTATARTFDSGFGGAADFAMPEEAYSEKSAARGAPAPAPSMAMSKSAEAPAPPRAMSLSSSNVETTEAKAAGDQFEFTVKKPVTLERRRSAMLPLVAGAMTAEKYSIWTQGMTSKNPMLGVRLVNSLGIKLPAGPITVFDGGAYAGDALIEFLPEKEKRLIVYGEDLSVTGSDSRATSTETVGVTVSKGVMIFSRRVTYARTYEFKNASATPRKILIEHQLIYGAELLAPASFDEKTDSLYRFVLPVPAAGQAKLDVKERSPATERVTLASLSTDSFLSYASSSEIPAAVKDALKKAVELRRKVDSTKKALTDLAARKTEIAADQERIRDNLSSVGRDSSQGQQYLKRLMDSETELDTIATKTSDAKKSAQAAQDAYDSYLANLTLN
jgi:hypothetical protein